MADKRDEQNGEERPRIQVVDNRLLTDDERAGKATERPKLEIVGGTSSGGAQSDDHHLQEMAADALEEDLLSAEEAGVDLENMSEEEQEEMRLALEEEQFEAIQQQIGRPLTEKEKDQVRQQMEQQAQAAISLDVAPVLLELMMKLPQFAAVHLGLMPNPYTQLVARNDQQAKMAIESFNALFETVRQQLDPNSIKEIERVLADLKANYQRITGQQIGQPSGPRIIH
jgi:beta-glucosidase-like glycosyl hydrolase